MEQPDNLSLYDLIAHIQDVEIPPEFEQALNKSSKAREYFDNLAPGYRKQYILWIAVAKRNETKQRRIEESIALIERGEKLGLK